MDTQYTLTVPHRAVYHRVIEYGKQAIKHDLGRTCIDSTDSKFELDVIRRFFILFHMTNFNPMLSIDSVFRERS
jgi:hypothetical protein